MFVTHVPKDIVAALGAASPSDRRKAAAAACAEVGRTVVVEHPAIESGLSSLKSGSALSPEIVAELLELSEQLDNHYLQLYSSDSTLADEGGLYAFAQARLATCIVEANGAHDVRGAVSAVYEAVAATGDAARISTIVLRELG